MVRSSPPGPGTDIERTHFPVFGLCWSSSLLVHCGGGGSSKTGVGNSIVCSGDGAGVTGSTTIDTGDDICVNVDVFPKVSAGSDYREHVHGPSFIAAAIGGGPVRIYHSVTGHCMGTYHPENKDWEGFNTVKFSPNGHALLAGCENGTVISFALHWDHMGGESLDHPPKVTFTKLATFMAIAAPPPSEPARGPPPILVDHKAGHSKAICCLAYNPFPQQANLNECLTCAKDGCLKLWNYRTGELRASMSCPIFELGAPIPKRQVQVLVRGCFYGTNGLMYTVQSGRRGKAYVSQWRLVSQNQSNQAQQQTGAIHPGQKQMQITLAELGRICIADFPISAMCMSSTATTLYCGSVEGSVIVIDAASLRLQKTYDNVHDLPVTAMSPRPSLELSPMFDMDRGVQVVTASADSKMVRLSTRRKPMSWIAFWVNFIFTVGVCILFWYSFAGNKCYTDLLALQCTTYRTCILYSLVAPNDMAGVLSIPM
jgi:WD40 repeat protein